ncbi:hypothetical protein BQ8794_70085 [Mesorhizobium prunaredense]|uniref:Uncharacterized protein n=1 Tax=Mesorhizobium prunaredense TaxID=1631249 RepID=A0A1R3VGV1_9HYPH|nr:hypothetical protein BQ8794_70085 [Mesorhizobium prunaredense]
MKCRATSGYERGVQVRRLLSLAVRLRRPPVEAATSGGAGIVSDIDGKNWDSALTATADVLELIGQSVLSAYQARCAERDRMPRCKAA